MKHDKLAFMDPEVSEYINRQKTPNKGILSALRKIIHETFPQVKEEMRFGVPWFEKFYLVSLKDHVNLGVCITGLTEAELTRFQGKGKLMRHIKFFGIGEINEKEVVKLLMTGWKSKASNRCG